MKRTQVAREVAAEMHTAEAAMDAALVTANAALERMVAAKTELGLTGTMGDAAIARLRDSVEALRDARSAMIESHQEAYTVLQATNIRGVAAWPTIFGTEGSLRRSA